MKKAVLIFACVVGLFAVGTVAVVSYTAFAVVQEGNIQGNIAFDDQDYAGRIVVITDPTPSAVVVCGDSLNQYKTVIINPGGGPATITTVAIDDTLRANPGDRFDINAQTPCDGRLDLSLTRR